MRIGLDIGTSNSAAAIFDGRAPRMIEIGEGTTTILPSVVCADGDDILVGQEAVERGRKLDEFCFRHFKRALAEPWHPDEDTGYRTREGQDAEGKPNGLTAFEDGAGNIWSPEELTSYLMEFLKKTGNAKLQPMDEVTGAVIGVPADFTQLQRDAMVEAARMAGLGDVELIHEPTAAALAYGFDAKKAQRIAVFDLGGGTFDVSIVQTGKGLVDVLATSGIRDLGGADWDQRIVEYVINLWRTEHSAMITKGEVAENGQLDKAMGRIVAEAERVKKLLSERERVQFRVENATRTIGGVSLHMIYDIDRRVFDELTRDLRERAIAACRSAIQDVRRDDPNFSVKDLNDILLVGGMTRVPSVRADVEAFFGKAPRRSESPEHVVAMGAAIRAAILDGRKIDLTIADITSHALALESSNGVAALLIPKGASYPLQDTFTLTNEAAGQKQLSIRLLQGDAAKASGCDVIWSAELPIEATDQPHSVKHALTVRIDASGRPSAVCAELEYHGEAA